MASAQTTHSADHSTRATPARVPRRPALPSGGDLRSVSIAVSVLECFLTTPELGASEVARRVGVAKSTAHRALASLATGGLLDRSGRGRYRLGLRLYDYGQLAIDRLYLREVALPILAGLRDQIGETVQLGIPAGAEVLYIDRLEGTNGLRFHSDSYRRVRAHSSSTGKAIAAWNPVVERAVIAAGFPRHTARTAVTAADYRSKLAEVRAAGFAVSTEEFEVGLSSVAAPVLLPGSAAPIAIAAISVAGPTARVVGRGSVVTGRVVEAAARLSKQLELAQRAPS